MKAVKYIVLLILVGIIGLSVYVAVQPNQYSFSRTMVTTAPLPLLFNEVNDFKNWPSFSPWLQKDPETDLGFGNITKGKNAFYRWESDVLGSGSMTTTSVKPNEFIGQDINITKPFETEAKTSWTFERENDSTYVTWALAGKQDFISKFYTTFSGSVESQMGPGLKRGLSKLDSVVKAKMKVYSIHVDGITNHSGGYYLFSTTSCQLSELETNIKLAINELSAYALTHNISMNGHPFIIYHKRDEVNNAAIFSACIPTISKITVNDSNILTGQLKDFKSLKATLQGHHDNLQETWNTALAYIKNKDNLTLKPSGPQLEVFVRDANETVNPAEWLTEIYIAIKE